MAAFKKDLFQNNKNFFLHGVLPEVGDLQRSSEVLDPSLESQSAVGATEVVIKHGRINPTLGLHSESLTKAMPIPTAHTLGIIKRQLY